ncbi:uncharacterized protein LOC112679680 [Sipha flava]|uniref:Uncharacterized protein LOC112679680 n=1 Tax=Sipha flava TaxID=143950 RepID=A0A2S2PW04_9HEMI|nr:uncharacterized protein LOC112679680 [Sipha flava]
MKSDRVLVTFSAFSILSVATALYQHNVSSTYVKAADDLNGDRDVIIKFLYTALYCDGRQCPSWSCQDDSAVIHGHCCGCPNPLKVKVPPVLCVQDLSCPYKMDELCEAYHFMITCCCNSPWQ